MILNRSKDETINLNTFTSIEAIDEFDKIDFLPIEKKFISKYFLRKGSKILDLGCGAGRTTQSFYEIGFDIIGIDISSSMVSKAKSNCPFIDFQVGDACSLQFSNEVFDYVIFSFNGIDYLYPEEKRLDVFREVNRVLKPNGLFIFSTHNSMQMLTFGLRNCLLYWCWYAPYLIRNLFTGKIFTRYRIEKLNFGELITYNINPFHQRKQLRENGFSLMEIVGNFDNKLKYLEPWLYYIAQKRSK
ncbi:MAG: class I SAM-dependent methyltransferase [Methanothrix sp.]